MRETIVVGSEHDLAIANAMMAVLRNMGAIEKVRQWAMAGSQEVNTLEFVIDGDLLRVESETYVGISISGEASVVREIAAKVRTMAGS